MPAGRIGGAVLAVAALGVGAMLTASPAAAQVRLEARYRVALVGLSLGTAELNIDLDNSRYAISAKGQVGGLIRVFSAGEGTGSAQGTLQGNRVTPQSYDISIRTKSRTDEAHMTYAGPAVKQIDIVPPSEPSPDAVPITEAHKRGTVDPFSAGLIPLPAEGASPDACRRSLPMFDGRVRFELALSYKRTEKGKIDGYEGPVLVCSVTFKPIAGHEPNRPAIKYLSASQAIEFWIAPIEGTQWASVYRIVVPTVLGPATMEATRFAVVGKPPHAARVRDRVKKAAGVKPRAAEPAAAPSSAAAPSAAVAPSPAAVPSTAASPAAPSAPAPAPPAAAPAAAPKESTQ